MQEKVHENVHETGTTEKETVTKRKRKIHTLKDSAIDAGLEAIKRLSETPTPAVKPTARTAIIAWLPAIISEKSRGTSLLRIYNDLKKATGIKISYRSFQNYVSQAAKEQGLRPVKQPVNPAPAPVPAPAAVQPPAAPAAPTMPELPAWNCPQCSDTAKRRESKHKPGHFYWKCAACGTFYVDEHGEMTMNRIGRE